MPIYHGSTRIGALYKGGASIARVYHGATLVFQKPSAGPSALLLTSSDELDPPSALLLSGDAQTDGNDKLLLSGDMA